MSTYSLKTNYLFNKATCADRKPVMITFIPESSQVNFIYTVYCKFTCSMTVPIGGRKKSVFGSSTADVMRNAWHLQQNKAFTSPVWKHPSDNNTGYECVYSKQESLCACVKCKHEICKLIILSALKLFFVSWTKVAETGVYLSAGDTNCGKNIISIKYVLG